MTYRHPPRTANWIETNPSDSRARRGSAKRLSQQQFNEERQEYASDTTGRRFFGYMKSLKKGIVGAFPRTRGIRRKSLADNDDVAKKQNYDPLAGCRGDGGAASDAKLVGNIIDLRLRYVVADKNCAVYNRVRVAPSSLA